VPQPDAANASAAAAAAANPGSTLAQPQVNQQQQQQLLQLQVTLLQPAEPQAAAATLSAIDKAAAAGLDSLQPGRSSGAMLTAAFEHILSETRCVCEVLDTAFMPNPVPAWGSVCKKEWLEASAQWCVKCAVLTLARESPAFACPWHPLLCRGMPCLRACCLLLVLLQAA
jgi:hypothetical protein